MDTQLSRSERKRRAKGIELLVQELTQLPPGEINLLPCAREVKAEIITARNLTAGTQKRQLKYIAKLLRDRPVDELFEFLARRKGSDLQKKREFQYLENLRDMLIDEAIQRYEENIRSSRFIDEHEPLDLSGESEALALIAARYPEINRNQLQDFAVQFARTRNKRFSRELFRLLKAASEKMQYTRKRKSENGI